LRGLKANVINGITAKKYAQYYRNYLNIRK